MTSVLTKNCLVLQSFQKKAKRKKEKQQDIHSHSQGIQRPCPIRASNSITANHPKLPWPKRMNLKVHTLTPRKYQAHKGWITGLNTSIHSTANQDYSLLWGHWLRNSITSSIPSQKRDLKLLVCMVFFFHFHKFKAVPRS